MRDGHRIFAVGNLLGDFVMLSLGDMRYKGIYALSGVLGFSVALVMLAFSSWFPLAFLAAALLGLAGCNVIPLVPLL